MVRKDDIRSSDATFDLGMVSKSSLCIRHSLAFGTVMYIWAFSWTRRPILYVYDMENLNGEHLNYRIFSHVYIATVIETLQIFLYQRLMLEIQV